MAGEPDTRTDVIESFGEVSRTVGVAFRYTLLAATLVGIVALGILLFYVALDAFRPLTADPGWWATVVALFVLPTVGAGLYLHRRTANGLNVGLFAAGVPLVAAMFGAGAAVLFIDIVDPVTWLGYVLALAVTGGVVVGLERSRRAPFLGKLVVTLAAFVATVLYLPDVVRSLPVLPSDGIILAVTLGVPAALLVRAYLGGRRDDARRATLVAAALFAVVLVSPFAGPFVGLGQTPAAVVSVSVLTPTLLYVAAVVNRDPDDPTRPDGYAPDRRGLWLPVVVAVSALLVAAVTEALGFAGPASWVDWQFLTSDHSNAAEQAGVYPALVGSIMLMLIVAGLSFPLGVGAAVYLEEYAPNNWFTRIVKVNISNLAGVPSIVYGLLGLGLFIRYAGAPPGTVFVGGVTLALLILPIVIISAQEALRSVPDSLRQASYGMGATRYQTIRNVVVPRAFPGILTGTILALGRAIGETAPLLVIGAPNIFDLPTELNDRVGAMPLQIYVWATTFADEAFYTKAIPAAVVVLLAVLLVMNSVAIVLRNRYQREA